MSHHYLKFTDVHFSYPGGAEVLKGVSFTITHGEKVALIGLNGAGKSTVLNLSCGLLLAGSGEVNIGDVPVSKSTLKLIRQSVGFVFQNPDDQLFMPTVEEDVAFGPLNMGLPQTEVERRVEQALMNVGMPEFRNQAPYRLSGGQKRRVAIATVLSMEPNILVMDEPTSDLDPLARRQLIDLLKTFSHTCIIATHDLEMARELCARTIWLDGGMIKADGPTEAIISDFLASIATELKSS